jgi:hypothetical protein
MDDPNGTADFIEGTNRFPHSDEFDLIADEPKLLANFSHRPSERVLGSLQVTANP